jgi:hypothetical protein
MPDTKFCDQCREWHEPPVSERGVDGPDCPRFAAFTCPRCGRTSYHPEDARQGYCGACHDWTGTPTM